MARGNKKIKFEEFQKDSLERKPYFYQMNLEKVRYRFRIEIKMVDNIRHNFPNKYRKKNLSLSCPSCKENSSNSNKSIDTVSNPPHSQTHLLLHCEAFSRLREDLDIENDEEVVDFFMKVVESRVKEMED